MGSQGLNVSSVEWSFMGFILSLCTCSDRWWPGLRQGSMTCASLGSVDLVGCVLEGGALRIVLRGRL